jgi:hypothetical protein
MGTSARPPASMTWTFTQTWSSGQHSTLSRWEALNERRQHERAHTWQVCTDHMHGRHQPARICERVQEPSGSIWNWPVHRFYTKPAGLSVSTDSIVWTVFKEAVIVSGSVFYWSDRRSGPVRITSMTNMPIWFRAGSHWHMMHATEEALHWHISLLLIATRPFADSQSSDVLICPCKRNGFF